MCLLGKVMTNGLAYNFNFDGQKQKLGFQKTRLWKTIEGRPLSLAEYCWILYSTYFTYFEPLLNFCSNTPAQV